VVAWAAFIFTLSSIPRLPSPPSAITDKHLHLGTYAVLAALLVRALARGTWTGVSMRVAIAAFVAATLYGVSDELHQRFVPGRDVSAGDLLADAAGAALAAGTLRAWAIIRRRS
jgi:VanZ family protein